MTHPADPARPANRLAGESSPYLLQHAHNPVDWWPWGAAAIAEARRRDVPIFLSIGYSTCYWCHVMERESFEDAATAALMNELFVNIKLDREERPDLDDVYMAAVQTLTGRGGWPMSVFLEPATLKPYWAGTYFPPRPAHGMPAFAQVLRGMSQAYAQRRAEVLTQAGEVAAAVAENLARPASDTRLSVEQVAMATQTLLTIVDRAHGGFGGAPKFPQPAYLDFLLDVRRSADPDSRAAIDTALRTTLDQMAIGGVHDQIGGGFHRYSVDSTWTVPHFEKMLYDNALLLGVYARAGRVFADAYYLRVARSTAEYVLAGMTGPAGAFFTAQDAEVDGREGLNYLWSPQEIAAAIPDATLAEFAAKVYGVSAGPNFRDPHHPDDPPRNVLRLGERPEKVAAVMGLSEAAFTARVTTANASLLAARSRRPQPRRDDKILTSWNGLMIAALAEAGRALNQPRYTAAAQRAADWLLVHHRGPDGRLLRTSRGGEARIPAMLEDVAMLMHGVIELARATDEPAGGANFTAARRLLAEADAHFADGAGGYYETAADATELFVRTQPTYDGAVPSGLSVMINNLVDLAECSGERGDLDRAVAALKVVSTPLAESPIARINSARGLLRALRLDASAVERAFADAPAGATTPSAPGADPVAIFASEEQILLAPDGAAALELRVEIAEPYHLLAPSGTAANAGPYQPLRIALGGGAGVAVYADYPPGEPLDPADPDSPRVYRGAVTLGVALERSGQWSGRPALVAEFQACTQRECLRARAVTLDVELRAVNG